MKTTLFGGALALPLLLCTSPARADDISATEEITAFGTRPDAHGPAGMMGDHVHNGGELMIGLEWMHMRHSGANVRGTAEVSDAEIAAAGYTVRATGMTMDMAMLHVMYGVNDRLTLTLMPTWNRMQMTMLGIAMPAMDGEHGGHHMLMPGETMTHSVSGVGDTRVGALYSLSRNPALSAHLGLDLSVPTGSVSRTNESGALVHYGMQPGSGTWDLEPSLTVRGAGPGFGWGTQVKYLWRTEAENRSGFAFGDRFTANAWASKPLGERVSLSARVGFTSEGTVEGHYNAPHNHASPPDRQANYGGEVVDAGIGANFVIGGGLRLGAEANVPLYQNLNGYQLPRDWGLNLSLTKTL